MLALRVAGAAVFLCLLDDLSYPAEELVQSIVSAVGTVPRKLEVDVLTSVLQLCRQINGDGEGGIAVHERRGGYTSGELRSSHHHR